MSGRHWHPAVVIPRFFDDAAVIRITTETGSIVRFDMGRSDELANRLQDACMNALCRSNADAQPTPKELREELERLAKICFRTAHEIQKVSEAASLKFGVARDSLFLANAASSAFGVELAAREIIGKETRRGKTRVKNKARPDLDYLVLSLAGIYREFTGRKPGRSRSTKGGEQVTKPGGPFVRFNQAVLTVVCERLSPEQQNDFGISKRKISNVGSRVETLIKKS